MYFNSCKKKKLLYETSLKPKTTSNFRQAQLWRNTDYLSTGSVFKNKFTSLSFAVLATSDWNRLPLAGRSKIDYCTVSTRITYQI